MRKIPVTMATQHPDNAFPSPFCGNKFVSTNDEIEECYRCFSELGTEEYMWDWEGKFVDEAVIDRLYSEYFDYFSQNPIGKDKFLTFRVPNIWEEKSGGHRLPRSFMNIFSAEHSARNYGLHAPPIFEIILPMTTSSDQLEYLQKKFQDIVRASETIFDLPTILSHIEVIPLFEDITTMADTDILEKYLKFLQSEYNYKPEYMRIFVARSDPAMNAGLVPTMLAVKNALYHYHKFGKKHKIKIYPWIGGGSLPFRGAINPENIEATLAEYRGAHSLTIQSSFRSDYPMDLVKSGIKKLNEAMPKQAQNPIEVSEVEREKIKKFNQEAAKIFQKTIEPLAGFINEIAAKMPNHRERVQHIGLFGYSRGVGQVKLPRAIKFCGAFYSMGIPPEFIATGRVLKLAESQNMLPLIEKLLVNLVRDLEHAGKYFNRENLDLLIEENDDFKPILEDFEAIEKYLGKKLGPDKSRHFLHRNTTSNIYYLRRDGEDISDEILRAAQYRKSLG